MGEGSRNIYLAESSCCMLLRGIVAVMCYLCEAIYNMGAEVFRPPSKSLFANMANWRPNCVTIRSIVCIFMGLLSVVQGRAFEFIGNKGLTGSNTDPKSG